MERSTEPYHCFLCNEDFHPEAEKISQRDYPVTTLNGVIICRHCDRSIKRIPKSKLPRKKLFKAFYKTVNK